MSRAGIDRSGLRERIQKTLDPDKDFPDESGLADRWRGLETTMNKSSADDRRAAEWIKAGCEPGPGTPYVVNALSRRLDEDDPMFGPGFATTSPQFARIVAAFRSSDCAGARGISEATKAMLERLEHPDPP